MNTRENKREENRREVEDYNSTNIIHAGAQRCTDRSSFFPPPFFVFFYSLADRRLRGSAARLRLCYEIGLKAKCSFSLFPSLARFPRRTFLFTIRLVASTRTVQPVQLALLSRPNPVSTWTVVIIVGLVSLVPPIFLVEREITIVPDSISRSCFILVAITLHRVKL